MSEYFGIVATAPSGSTAGMELVSGRDAMVAKVAEWIDSDHTVRLFKCLPVEYHVHTMIAIHLEDE